ncbi:hypothetical protein [Myceligenerans pegani]|nr:hypothetical protein [Myceligenerans sp. TRM 65318]MBE3017971.1 hypothetical protein [Myceligenerans sp. TRM 65318]
MQTLPASTLAWHLGSGESVRHASGAADMTQNGTRVETVLRGGGLRPGQSMTFRVAGTANADEVAAPETFTLDNVRCAAP